jgi:hypothetical protein
MLGNGTRGTSRQEAAVKQPSIQQGHIIIIADIMRGWWELLLYNNTPVGSEV